MSNEKDELSNQELLKLHETILNQSPSAPRRMVAACGLRLVAILRNKYSLVPEEMLTDSVYDALLEYLDEPNRYSTSQGSLMNYLTHIACRRLIDRFRANSRRHEKFVGHDVELARIETNNYQTGQEPRSGLEDEVIEKDIREGIDALARQILTDGRDLGVWELMQQGRTATEDFVRVLALSHLPLDEQRTEVKRHRDRIQKKIRRQKARFEEFLS